MIFIVWHGTNFEELFSRRHVCVMAIMLAMDLVNMILFLINFSHLLTDYEKDGVFTPFNHDIFLLAMLNGLNNMWILTQFLYFGVIKRGLERETTEIVGEIEQDLELVSKARNVSGLRPELQDAYHNVVQRIASRSVHIHRNDAQAKKTDNDVFQFDLD